MNSADVPTRVEGEHFTLTSRGHVLSISNTVHITSTRRGSYPKPSIFSMHGKTKRHYVTLDY